MRAARDGGARCAAARRAWSSAATASAEEAAEDGEVTAAHSGGAVATRPKPRVSPAPDGCGDGRVPNQNTEQYDRTWVRNRRERTRAP